MKKRHKQTRRWPGCLLLLIAAAGLVAFPFVWRDWIHQRYAPAILPAGDVPPERVAIVFGAAVYADGRLSAMLRDRVETAIQLYEAGRVDRLLMSGDNSSDDYNEPARMIAYAQARGVPPEALQPDYGGRRTYDTCYRARHIFGVESAVLVTQAFHLPRALFTCGELGIAAVGVAADMRPYHPFSVARVENREIAALVRALWDVIWKRPADVMGEPIRLSGS